MSRAHRFGSTRRTEVCRAFAAREANGSLVAYFGFEGGTRVELTRERKRERERRRKRGATVLWFYNAS